jgi:phenylpropionate dioxygenase-like ring-hydroxylating dioxygenase large terminal subunit
LLFDGPRIAADDLAPLADWPELGVSDYVFGHSAESELPVNWKIFVEVFLDNLHVGPYHKGLRSFVDVRQLQRGENMIRGDWFAAQRIGSHAGLMQYGSAHFAEMQQAILRLSGGQAPACAASWVLYYPNIFIEIYPFMLIVSTYEPIAAERTRVAWEYYYQTAAVAADEQFVRCERLAWADVGDEDDEIAIALHRGRRALFQSGREDWGPYQSPMEDAMREFHRFLQRELGPAAG